MGKFAHLRRVWKSEELDGKRPSGYDWARIAAFIDGEGNLNINPFCRKGSTTQNHAIRVLIGNTNPILPIWLQETFGGHIVSRDYDNPKWKVAYIWSCSSSRAAWILYNCEPWLLLKSDQAKLLIRLQENLDTTIQGRGLRVSPESIEFREGLKTQLHKLNAKGPSVRDLELKERN